MKMLGLCHSFEAYPYVESIYGTGYNPSPRKTQGMRHEAGPTMSDVPFHLGKFRNGNFATCPTAQSLQGLWLDVVGTSPKTSKVQPAHQQTQSAQGPKDQDACNSAGRHGSSLLEGLSLQWIENHIVTFLARILKSVWTNRLYVSCWESASRDLLSLLIQEWRSCNYSTSQRVDPRIKDS